MDLILAETHNTIREAAAALSAAKAAGAPVILSLVTDGEGKLLSGETLEDAARALLPLAPDALGINCVPAARLAGDLARLAAAAPGVPLAAYGNLGLPADDKGWAFTDELSPDEYAEHARAGSPSVPASSGAAAAPRRSTPGRCGGCSTRPCLRSRCGTRTPEPPVRELSGAS